MKKRIITFFILGVFNIVYAQMKGVVLDVKTNKTIPYASIVLFEKGSNKTKGYTNSDEKGMFSFDVEKDKLYRLKVYMLGYKTKTEIIDGKKSKITILLEEKAEKIDEVVIKSTNYKSFYTKKDSIIFNLSKIKDGTENKLKDLVEKLPGLTIDSNKKISFQGKKIDRVVIEGQDFFGKKHEMATENLPAEAIEGIQILKNFKDYDDVSNEKTGKIVLNVSLNQSYRNKIVGNIEGNSGIYEKYQAHSNLFKFFKKGNIALVSELNNIGESAVNLLDYIEMQGGIGNFTDNYRGDGVSGVYELDNSKIPRYVIVDKNVDSRKTIFNSLNFVDKLSEKTKMNAYVTFDITKIQELQNSVKKFAGTNNMLKENEDDVSKSFLGNSFFNIVYKKDTNKVLKYNLKINPLKNNEQSFVKGNINFDTNVTDKDLLVGQYIEYKNQIKPNLYFKSRFSYDYKKQNRRFNLKSNQPFLNLTFLKGYNIEQKTDVNQHYLNLYSNMAYSFSNQTKLSSLLSLSNSNESFGNYAENQPKFNFDVYKNEKRISFSNSLTHKFSRNFSVNAVLEYVHSKLGVSDKSRIYKWLLPKLSVSYKFDNERDVMLSYSETKTNIPIYQMNSKDRLLDGRIKVGKNMDIFTPIAQKNYGLNYSSFKSSKNRLISIQLNYFTAKNTIGYNTLLNNSFIEQKYMRVPKVGGDVNLHHSKTFRSLPLKWDNTFSYRSTKTLTYFKDQENNNNSQTYLVSSILTTSFKNSPFQVKLKLYGDKMIVKNDFSNLDFTITHFNITPKIYGKVKNFFWDLSCLYQNVETKNYNQNIYSLNFLTQWNFSEKIQLFFKGTNILNLKNNEFIYQLNSDAFSQFSVYQRLEGCVLVGLRYHF